MRKEGSCDSSPQSRRFEAGRQVGYRVGVKQLAQRNPRTWIWEHDRRSPPWRDLTIRRSTEIAW